MFQKPVIQKLGGNTESFKIHYEDGTATSSRNNKQSSCNTQCDGWSGTLPLSLCEREQLLTSLRVIRDAGEGLNKGLRSLVKYCDLSLYFFKKIIYNNVMHHNIKHSNIERETYKGATHVTHFGNICQAAFNLVKGNTHVTTYNNIRRAAFTLAEVLITLGIIGVVAAMTMPTLINSTQKQELVAQYKKI